MKRLLGLVLAIALTVGCKPTAHKMATALPVSPPIFQVIPAGTNPNTLGIPGAVGNRLQNSGGANGWVMGIGGVWVADPPPSAASANSGMAFGANLGDASVTVNPGTDSASAYLMPAATMSTNRTTTAGTGGTPISGLTVTFFRYDLTANTWTILDGGPAATSLCVFPASPTKPEACSTTWNGTDWASPAFYYLGS